MRTTIWVVLASCANEPQGDKAVAAKVWPPLVYAQAPEVAALYIEPIDSLARDAAARVVLESGGESIAPAAVELGDSDPIDHFWVRGPFADPRCSQLCPGARYTLRAGGAALGELIVGADSGQAPRWLSEGEW